MSIIVYKESSAVGNVAKLREACGATLDMIFELQNSNKSPLSKIVYSTRRKINAALSAPPRNCDVGTAEEQAKRFSRFCDANKYVGDDGTNWCSPTCPCYNIIDCGVKWAQMPYKENEAAK